MKPTDITVAVVDDHKLFRTGLIPIINSFNGIKVVIEADGGKALFRKIREIVPQVILLDIKMPEMSGTEVTKILRTKYPKVKIIILTMYDNTSMITSLYKSGAHGYLLKSIEPEEVEKAIHSVIETGYYFNPTISIALLKNLVKDKIVEFDFKEAIFLDDNELLVIEYMCEELTSKEIAEVFCRKHKIPTGERTIERIKSDLIKKLGVKNASGIIIYALRSGIVE